MNQQARCSRCGAQLQRQTVTDAQTIEGKVYIVEDVPAWICQQCGEQYLSAETMQAIQDQLERGQPIGTRQVPVYRLPQPTS
jgi:YgiT-type zinc finger domain-containing protein